MTGLTEQTKEAQKQRLTLEQIDEYDSVMREDVAKLGQINGGTRISDNSRMCEAHGVEIRKALMIIREQMVLYEWYKARLG